MGSPQLANQGCRVDARAQAGGVCVEIRHYGNVPPGHNVTYEPRNTVGLTLAQRQQLKARYPSEICSRSAFTQIGGTVFRPRRVPWEVITTGGEIATLLCVFEDDLFDATLGPDPHWTPAELEDSLDLRSAPITQMLRMLRDEVQSPGFASPVLIEATATAILVHLARYLRRDPPERRTARHGLSSAQLRAIDEYLEQACGHCPTAGELARLCGVSTRNLQRKIRQSTGMSISAYVAEAQLARAKALLKQRRLPLKEIAYQLGFSSHSNFSAAFRKAVGQSPSEYRDDHA